MEGLREPCDPQVMSLAALRELGPRTNDAPAPRRADAPRQAACRPEDLAILVYTSGTTGKPKGAMHSHRGLVYTVRGYNTLVARRTAARRAHVLPAAVPHRRALGGEYFRALHRRPSLNFVENPETVPENVREIAPTVFTAVPRVWEKFYSGVMIALKEASASCSRPPTPGPSVGHARSPTGVLAGQPVRRC